MREFAELVQDVHSYEWIVFTNANGVDAFFEIFYKLYDDAREIGGTKFGAVGAVTAQRIKEGISTWTSWPKNSMPSRSPIKAKQHDIMGLVQAISAFHAA